MLFCLAALISRHRQNFPPRGFVFPDRLSTFDRRPRPKSLRRAGLRSRFPMRVSFLLQEERPLKSRISRLILTLSPRGLVFPDRLSTLDRRPRPKSLRRAGLRSRFPIKVSFLLQEERFCFRRSDPLYRGYLGYSLPFPGADWCFQTTQTPLIDGQGRNRSAAQA